MKRFLLSALFFALPTFGAEPRFVPAEGGEIAVDLAVDLAQLPAFTWATDPFLKSSGLGRGPASAQAEEEYKLQAVTLEGNDSIAVVNDRVVRVGDRVGRRTILKIGTDFVLLGAKGSVIEATLEEPKPQADRAPAGGAGAGGSLGSSGTGGSPVPANMRPSADNPAMKAGKMLDNLLNGQISIEEVKK